MSNKENIQEWTEVIEAKRSLLQINLKEIWRYRDLISLLVRRDFVANYKQTILGPIWFFLQPLFTTLMFTLLFARMGKLSTDGLPPMLFYMCGITFWNYFAECLKKNSTTFIDNQSVFGKVYFPRLVLPISVSLSNTIRLGIQFLLFLATYLYFILNGSPIRVTSYVLLLPVNVLLLGLLSLGIGVLISSLTTKYRDLRFLIDFGVQLLMYATVIFPASSYPEKYQWVAKVNPLIPLMETTKLGLLGAGSFDPQAYLGCVIVTIISLFTGVLVFNMTEQNFMDVV
ncbi:MAG: ABC transporter permease [Chitinophagales bacterium]|nr:ABC transporter permease [Chitinophagales bacterium]